MDEMTPDECRNLLETAPVVHLGVVGDGEPYVTPLSFVYRRGSVFFRTGPGRRMDAIRHDPWVCVEASSWDPATGDWESVVGWGEAREVTDGEEGAEVVAGLLQKYRQVMGSPLHASLSEPLRGLDHVVEVPLTRMSGRSSGRAWGPPTRPGRL